MQAIISELSSHGYNQVLLECGPTLGNALLREGFIDELIVYRSPVAVESEGINLFEDESELLDSCELISQISIGPDTKSHYLLTKVGD
jgi:riboflavin biosynthesis pyrimidine reductase